jgi:HEAT repeat protein
MVNELDSEVSEQRARVVDQSLKQRSTDVAALIGLAERLAGDPSRQGTVKDTLGLLGRLRAMEAVPLMVRLLTFEVYYKNTKRPQTTSDLYPAVQALIDIGPAAIDPVLERVRVDDDGQVQRNAAVALRGMLGAHRARLVLADEAQRAPTERSRVRLQATAAALEQAP